MPWAHDSIGRKETWHPENVAFLRERLHVDYLDDRLSWVMCAIEDHPESNVCLSVQNELHSYPYRAEARCEVLPDVLSRATDQGPLSWQDAGAY